MQPKFDKASKPVATYYGRPTFHAVYDTETGERREYAVVGDVRHPRLGHQPVVYTSIVELKSEDGKTFETKNTIYKPAAAESNDYNAAGCMNGPC